MSYKWEPETCSLAEFDPDKFVELLGSRKIFLIGDSLSDQQFHAMACLLGERAKFTTDHCQVMSSLSNKMKAVYKKDVTLMKTVNPYGKKKDPYGVPDAGFKNLKTPKGGVIRFQVLIALALVTFFVADLKCA